MALGRRIRQYFRGGDLSGSAPSPTVTQARGLRETAGPTTLTMAAVTDGEFLKRSGTTVISAAVSPAFETLTDGATVTWAFAGFTVRNATLTLGGNRTLDITGETDGCTGLLIVKQDATGSRTLTLPGSSKVVGGGAGAITLSTAANSVDIISFYYDGTNFWWTYGKNFT